MLLPIALALTSFGPVVGNEAVAAPPRFDDVVNGVDAPPLSGDDVLQLERYVGSDALALVRAVGAAVDDAADNGCSVSPEESVGFDRVGRHLLAIAVVEASRARGGTAMALNTAADYARTLNHCLPFGAAQSAATQLAISTASTASYLRSHGALDDEEAQKLSTALASLAKEKAAALARPTVVSGALVLAPAGVKCRLVDGKDGTKTVLTASEAREIGRRYQQRPPQFTPKFGPKGIEGMVVVVDAFLASCGMRDGDVVQSINGVRAENVDRLLNVGDRIGADRKAVVVVVRGGAPVTLTIDEDVAR